MTGEPMPIPKPTRAATIANLKSSLRGNMTFHSCVAATNIPALNLVHNHPDGLTFRHKRLLAVPIGLPVLVARPAGLVQEQRGAGRRRYRHT
jgi:hypothetical protein